MLKHSDFQQVHNYSANGVIAVDERGLIVYANPKAAKDYFVDGMGQPVTRFFKNLSLAPADPKNLLANTILDVESLLVTIAGHERNVLLSSAIYKDDSDIVNVYLFIRDITILKKKENLLAYLNTATEELAQARNTKSALDKISRLIVPKFANWFSIDLLRDGQLDELVLAHEDPGMIQWARKYREAYPTDLDSDSSTAKVVKTGAPSFIPVITKEMVLASVTDPGQLEAILRMNLQSVITVAIFTKEAVSGIISFISSTPCYHYDETDLRFAQNLANHIGLALENAQLNEAAINEIAQRKKVEEKLAITQVQLQSALSSGLVGTWILDLEKDILYPDENLSRMFGVDYSPHGCKQEVFSLKIHPDDRQLIDEKRKKSIRHGEVYETEYRVINNGVTHWFFARGQTEAGTGGKPKQFTGVIMDITKRKEAEMELKESGELFRFLADAIPHKMWTSEPDGSVTYYNQGWYDYTGISDFEELKVKVWDILHPDDLEKAALLWPKTIREGKESTTEQRFRRHDGQYRWHLSRFSAHKDENGQIKLWVGTSTDIHEQKAIQEALERGEAHFKALTQLNSLPIWQVNANCETIFVNDTWRVFTGVDAEKINEADWTENIHPEDRDKTVQQFNALFDKQQMVHLKYRFRHAPTNEYRWMLDNAQPVFNPEFDGYIGTMTDIHEQEQARLAIQQLMSKKDEFISIASHELKTPLTSIKAFNQLMLRTKDETRLTEFGKKTAEHILRLEKLISDLLDVTKINAGKMNYNLAPFSFRQMLTDSVESAKHTAPDYEIILEGAPDITYTGDQFRLEQVMHNFISNAIKYSPDGKKVIINSKVELGNIVVSVQDFGIGIAPDNLDRLFDRYYRVDNTAMRFEGLGLGLFISSEILKRHQGSFWIESELGKGSTFYFRLPVSSVKKKEPVVKTDTFYRDSTIIISYNKDNKRLDVDWTGFQGMDSIKRGCLLMLKIMAKNKCDRIVNDNTHVLGNWSEAADWVGNEWFPMMEQAGLKYFALIFSPSTFSQLSAKKSIDIMAGIITTQYFTNIRLAEEWIDSRSRPLLKNSGKVSKPLQ
jgi:PAS domain S-box-containing protein